MKAILTYHSIDDSGSPISIPPGTFGAHARWLASGRVRVLSLDDLVAHPANGEDAIAVTFDDGFLNTREPIEALLASGVPATIFAVSGHVGGTNDWGAGAYHGIPRLPLLDWDQLGQLVARGATVAAHARTHTALTTISDGAVDEELLGCLDDIEAKLGVRSGHLAYPYGDVNDAVAARAARYFRWGHTVEFGCVTNTDSPMRLPRLDAYYFRGPGALESWGTRRFAQYVAWCRTKRWLRARLVG